MPGDAGAMLRRAFGGALDTRSLQELRRAASSRTFATDEIILRQGEPGDAFFVITSGRAIVTQLLDDGTELELDVLIPGQYVGELALLDQAPRMATCRALTPVTALEFNRQVFTDMMRNNPAVAYTVLLNVLGNMRQQDKVTIEELRLKNEELIRAYDELRLAQAELVEKERLDHELALAANVQQSLLPGALPEFANYQFAAYHKPARAVGGDFYDVIVLDDQHVGLLLADVADKGLHASLIMAVARTLFRSEAQRSLSPADVALAVHRGLLDLERLHETFITAFYGVLHLPSGRLTYIRAAQEKPLLLRPGYASTTIPGGDRFLGMLTDLSLTEQMIELREGERLLIFSDGVPDATNEMDEPYGYEQLGQIATQGQSLPVAALVQVIVGDIEGWIGNADSFDDLTLLAVEMTGNRIQCK